MLPIFDGLRSLTFGSLALRILLAVLFGGLIGIERERHSRAAGLRTYSLVCIGATLAVMLSEYEYEMIHTVWADTMARVGIGTDVSRFGAQVINGIGFLGAGSILVTGRQEVKGLTTAAGLWACACVGLAIGAGFYEAVFVAFILIFLCIRYLNGIATKLKERSKNMNLYVEFTSLDQIAEIVGQVKAADAKIYDMEIAQPTANNAFRPSVVMFLGLGRNAKHTDVLAKVSLLPSVTAAEEI